jgi:arylsulfatase A-like enzyme
MQLIDLFLEELRGLDRFDSSIIIIHGDHGARFELNEAGDLERAPGDFYSERWSDARSRSLLLVKPAGIGSSTEFEISDYPAELTDVVPTVFDSVGLEFKSRDGRTSLLSASPPSRGVRFYHFYDKRDDHLPDGEVVRFVISDEGIAVDRTISLPAP